MSEINRLADTTSPYLLQHAHNPVDWYPWGEEALALARDQDRPILLSIGYSACHWCHVMAHESFEDPDTAAVMNELFVNVKVDREERPDLDRIYQTAHQLLAGRPGGWPLTVFLAPDQTPFFGGTYFPSEPRHGLPAFRDILRRVAAAYREQRAAIGEQNQALREALQRIEESGAGAPGAALLDNARLALASAFDTRFGGFGEAPKFPQPSLLNRLLRTYARSLTDGRPDGEALDMAGLTLRRMALGGIYDQVGGGFARYSVDNHWMIPHFEKMLYDNAQLLAVYTDAWRATGDTLFRRVALETADWALREMRHPNGGFYASLDADSEGGEGMFYLWTPEQIRDLLPPEQAELVEHRFGLDQRPNFEGRWHLHVHATFAELASRMQRPRDEIVALWKQARERLLAARDHRTRPHRDEKIITGWNALMASGLARAGRFLDAPGLTDAAADCLAFLRKHVWVDGRLRAGWKDGRAELPGYLEDHAFLLAALLEQIQARWEPTLLDWARELAELLLARFEDRDRGGFHLTADDHEALIQRPRPFGDDSCPAGNGVAALALGRLGHLLAEPRYLAAAERTLHAAGGAMAHLPQGHCTLLDALEEHLDPPTSVLLRPAERPEEWRRQADTGFDPARLVVTLPAAGEPPTLGPATLEGHGAWVCRGTSCLPRADTLDALADKLANTSHNTGS